MFLIHAENIYIVFKHKFTLHLCFKNLQTRHCTKRTEMGIPLLYGVAMNLTRDFLCL